MNIEPAKWSPALPMETAFEGGHNGKLNPGGRGSA